MTATVVRQGDLWRVIDNKTGRVCRPTDNGGKAQGKAFDMGGRKSKAVAQALADRLNSRST